MSDDNKVEADMVEREATAAYVASQLTRGEDAIMGAERRARLSEMVATAGINDIVQGAQLVVASEDVQALSAVVGALNADDLEDTMEIASISGELSVISDVLYAMDLPVISAFLQDRGERLKELAVDNIMRYGAVRALTEAMEVTGEEIAMLGDNEMAEGEMRIEMADIAAASSEVLASAGEEMIAEGLVTLAASQGAQSITGETEEDEDE